MIIKVYIKLNTYGSPLKVGNTGNNIIKLFLSF